MRSPAVLLSPNANRWFCRVALVSQTRPRVAACAAVLRGSRAGSAVGSKQARLSIPLQAASPNPALNRTCAKSRAGRLALRWACRQMKNQIQMRCVGKPLSSSRPRGASHTHCGPQRFRSVLFCRVLSSSFQPPHRVPRYPSSAHAPMQSLRTTLPAVLLSPHAGSMVSRVPSVTQKRGAVGAGVSARAAGMACAAHRSVRTLLAIAYRSASPNPAVERDCLPAQPAGSLASLGSPSPSRWASA